MPHNYVNKTHDHSDLKMEVVTVLYMIGYYFNFKNSQSYHTITFPSLSLRCTNFVNRCVAIFKNYLCMVSLLTNMNFLEGIWLTV